jgi:stage II sporulation protein D
MRNLEHAMMRAVRPRVPLLALGLLVALFCTATAQAQPLVRVLLADGVDSVDVVFDGPHRGAIDDASFETPFALAWPVLARDGRLLVDGQDVGQTLDLTSDDGVSWSGRRYRGTLRLLAEGQGLRVLNVLDLESYLRGVVPAEMQANWPREALRAQSVAARTYTVIHLDPARVYDVCATDECQVYRGRDAERPTTDAALIDTQGQVLTYRGDYARTYYHSDSGGVIASAAEVWGGEIAYLQAFQDVESVGPHRVWTARLDPARVAASLHALGLGVGAVVRLGVLSTSASGRVIGVEVVGREGRSVLDGATLRSALRGWGLKSTRFTMTGDLSVRGEGWGHGVGMSQYGARALAEQGYDYTQILGFYYPETRLQRLTTYARR